MFDGNIRAFVPQIAMSAGTMIACACNTIIMGKQSNIGPIDPQFNNIPAQGVISEFKKALDEIKKNPINNSYMAGCRWQYHPTFIEECQNAIDMSAAMVKEWLCNGMFNGENDADEKSQKIVNYLMSHKDTKTHARHIHMEEAQDIGLDIKSLESDFPMIFRIPFDYPSCIHAYIFKFWLCKIVENN